MITKINVQSSLTAASVKLYLRTKDIIHVAAMVPACDPVMNVVYLFTACSVALSRKFIQSHALFLPMNIILHQFLPHLLARDVIHTAVLDPSM